MTVAVAFAAPLVHKPMVQAICDAEGGVRYIALMEHGDHLSSMDHASPDSGSDSGDTADVHSHEMQCSLCFMVKEPPTAEFDVQPLLAHPLAYALTPLVSAEIEARAGAPLPPRGPPVDRA